MFFILLVLLPTVTAEEIIVEDGDMDNTKNPDITWSDNWSVWNGEADRHHGGTKTESTTGATITYKFTGTGIEVYSQKHANFASFDISIDSEDKGNFSLDGSSSGDDQQLVAAFKELENGEHTIVMKAVDRDGKNQVNLDYFKVFKAINGDIVDKSELQTEIEAHSNKVEANYTSETWSEFKAAYDKAVEVMNDDDSTGENVTSALEVLREKANELVAQEAQGPEIPDSAKVEAVGVESKTLVLTWPSIDRASIYEVYEGETKVGETVNNYYRVNDLTADTEYNFTVKAVNEAGKATAFEAITVKTELAVDIERPSNIESISVKTTSKTSAEVSWSEATDNIGVVGYKVYVNGTLKAQVEGLNYTLEGLDEGVKYIVKIVAIDKAGNTSLIPASARFIIGDEEVPPTENKGDKAQLISLIEKIEALDSSNYIEKTWEKLAKVLEESKAVVADENASEEEVSKSYDSLLRVYLELRLKPNKDALNDLIKKAQSLDSSKYTKSSWSSVEKAVEEANKVIENEDATEQEVAKAEENLNIAISALEIASNDSTNSATNNGSNNKEDGKTTSNSKLPKTGGTNAVYILIVGAALVVTGGVFMFTRKKKSDNTPK